MGSNNQMGYGNNGNRNRKFEPATKTSASNGMMELKIWNVRNRLLHLLFRLAGESSVVFMHFTQNVCSHVTIRQMIYDSTISHRYKVALSTHLRSDKEVPHE